MKSREDFGGRPILSDLLEYLKAHRQRAGLVFGSLNAERWKELVATAGVPWLRPNDLRRCSISRCRRTGVPMEIAMFLSDHRDLATVLKYYRAIDPIEIDHSMELLAGSITARPSGGTAASVSAAKRRRGVG